MAYKAAWCVVRGVRAECVHGVARFFSGTHVQYMVQCMVPCMVTVHEAAHSALPSASHGAVPSASRGA